MVLRDLIKELCRAGHMDDRVLVETASGRRLAAWCVRPKSPAGQYDTVIGVEEIGLVHTARRDDVAETRKRKIDRLKQIAKLRRQR